MLFLSGIGIKTVKKEPLVSVNNVLITLEKGMEGDVRGGGGRDRRRQITVISMNQWRDVCSDMGWNPRVHSWMLRRAGLCIEGVWFAESHIGQYIRIGEDVVLQVTGETEPCEVMNKIAQGLKDVLAVNGRAGVTCRVIQGGRVATGNGVVIRDQSPL